MKMIYGVAAVILIAIIFFLAWQRLKKTGAKETEKSERNNSSPFTNLRNMAFRATAKDLNIDVDSNLVWGIIMDWNLGDGAMTLVSYRTGDASMYLSSGGGIIGGGQHEIVRQAVSSYLDEGYKYIGRGSKVDHTNLPSTEDVYFYLLTTDGRYLLTEHMTNFENETSELYPLFVEANRVISELRMISEMK